MKKGMEMNTYRIILRIALVLALLMYAGVAFGDAGHGKSVGEVLTEIHEKFDLGPQ
jgi:hypothetical protein